MHDELVMVVIKPYGLGSDDRLAHTDLADYVVLSMRL